MRSITEELGWMQAERGHGWVVDLRSSRRQLRRDEGGRSKPQDDRKDSSRAKRSVRGKTLSTELENIIKSRRAALQTETNPPHLSKRSFCEYIINKMIAPPIKGWCSGLARRPIELVSSPRSIEPLSLHLAAAR